MSILDEYERGQLSEEDIYRRLQEAVLEALLWFTAYFYIEKQEPFDRAYELAVLLTSEQIRGKEIEQNGETVSEPYQFQKILQYDVNSFIPQDLINVRLPKFMKRMEDLKRSEPQNSDRTQELIDKINRIFHMRKALADVQPPLEQTKAKENNLEITNLNMMIENIQDNVFLREIASPNAALANDSFTKPLGEEATRTTKSKKKKKDNKTFSTTSIINWNPREWQAIDKNNVPYRLLIQDRAIHDIIDSIKQEKDKKGEECYISPAEIYRNLTGSTDTHSRVSDIMIEKIDQAMNRLFASRLSANLTEEFEERGIKGKPIFTQHLILTDGEMFIEYPNGGVSKKYEIVKPPILGEWSRKTGQVTHIPPKMLAYTEKRRTYENIGIVYYIARRIIQITNGQSNVILFDTIIESTIENPQTVTAKKRTTIVKYVEGYLDYLKAEGFINSYKLINEGRTWRSVEITPSPLKLTENKDT